MTSSAGQRISCNVVETRRDDVARIFNIQRYSLNDGEGIRTVVFFKGCPHLCPWCANPESISGKIQTVRREAKCLHCAKCLRDADECPSGAFERIGRDISLDALEREVMKDDIFFRTSGGQAQAKRAMPSNQCTGARLGKLQCRIPHQRSITEDPHRSLIRSTSQRRRQRSRPLLC